MAAASFTYGMSHGFLYMYKHVWKDLLLVPTAEMLSLACCTEVMVSAAGDALCHSEGQRATVRPMAGS